MSARVRIARRVFCVRYASQRLYVGVGRDGFVAAGRASRRRFHHASFVASRADRRLRRSPSVDAGDTPLPGVPLSAVYRYRPLSPSMVNRIQNRHPPSCVASVLALSGGGPPTSPMSSSSGRFPPKSDEVHARYPATMPEKNSSQNRMGHMLADVARAHASLHTPRAPRSGSPRRLPGGDISTSQDSFASVVARLSRRSGKSRVICTKRSLAVEGLTRGGPCSNYTPSLILSRGAVCTARLPLRIRRALTWSSASSPWVRLLPRRPGAVRP